MRLQQAVFAALMLAGTAQAQVYQCRLPDGKVSFADRPCPGSTIAPVGRPPAAPAAQAAVPARSATPLAASPSERATAEYRQWIDANDKPKALLDKGRECDSGRGPAPACAEYERMRDAYYQSIKPGLIKGSQKVADALHHDCSQGDRKACEQVCPPLSVGESQLPTFLLNCAKVLGRAHGSFWWVSNGQVDADQPVSPMLARQIPEGGGTLNDIKVTCFRKRVSPTEVQADSFTVRETSSFSRKTGALVVSYSYQTYINQHGVNPPTFTRLQDWAHQSCPR